MTDFTLGINTCFAVKRWPEPERWAAIVRNDLGLGLVQHSLDLVDINASESVMMNETEAVRAACRDKDLLIDSTFTGLAAYSANMLLDPRAEIRALWEAWLGKAITFTAAIGAPITGGHVGAYCVTEWRDEKARSERWRGLKDALARLGARAKDEGLTGIYVENLAAAREPATMSQIDTLLTPGDSEHVPILLCLDVGHQCVPGTSGPERDPYAWLAKYGGRVGAVQLQQSDADADHHWPFTAAHNVEGRIDARRVLAALDEAGAERVTLLFEIIPSFEQDDDVVLAELSESVEYWKAALEEYGSQASRPS
jgi:D-erythrulose 1-phosphate 3-epimerase